jgi:hypothetical protein
MGVVIKMYGARIGGSISDNEVESVVIKRMQDSLSANFRFVGLVNGGMEMNPASTVKQVKIAQMLAYVKTRRKRKKGH